MCDHVWHLGKVDKLFLGLILSLCLARFSTPAPAAPVDADLLLQGGTIHDGSGAAPVVGDVAVRDGRIVAVGELTPGKIGRTVDCRGLIVAPGLIDLHTHSDATLAQPGVRPALNYLIQGCTTMGTGNCGSAKDVAKFLKDVDTNGAGTNIVHLVGHGSVRRDVMGSERRAPTAEELERIKALVGQAMRDGAWGMSTGLIYAPGSYAQTEELVALAKVVAVHGGIYVSHIRDEGDHLLAAVEEALEIGRRSGAPVHISHFKSMQIPNWGRIRQAVATIEKARAGGLAITADQYPYTANSFSLADATLPDAEIRWSRANLAKRMASEPEFAATVRRVIADQLGRTEKIEIAASKKFPDYVGRSLQEIAAEEKIDTVDLVLKILSREAPQIVSHSMSEADVRWAMTLPWVATASDGSARTQNPNEHHHPRNFGTFARKIGHYAIQEKVLSLPQAIRSATGLPADIFGITERGYLRPGYHADIMVFDPAVYRDRATFTKPQEYATGVRYVFLAGQVAVDEGKPIPKLLGRALRHSSTVPSDKAPDQLLRAGAAAADITPPLGERVIGGFEPFPSTAIHDKLYARCLVLDNGEAQIAFVICDNLGIIRDVLDEARQRIAKETKLPPLNILMAATHTHSGTRAQSEKYRPVVVRGIVEAVRGALANLEPAKIGWGGIDEPSEVFNRRWFVSDPERLKNPFGGVDKARMNPGQNHPSLIKPAGPVDPEISVLSVQATDGRPIAILANYSLHYVGGVNKGEISADYFGIFSGRIGELLEAESANPPFVGILTNGTSGDVNNIHFGLKTKRYERYERMNEVAQLVAKRVKEVCGRIEYQDWVPLGSKRREVTLKIRKPDEKMREYFAGVTAKPEDAPKYHSRERNYAGRVGRLFEGPDEVRIPLQAVRIGDLGITAIPFEVLAEIGLQIKEKTPFGDTFTIELANDYHGYLPTPHQHELGGYETWMGTCKVQKDASVVIVDQLLAMLAELGTGKRGP